MSTVFTAHICLLIGLQSVITSANRENINLIEIFEHTRKNLNLDNESTIFQDQTRAISPNSVLHKISISKSPLLKRYKRIPQDNIPPFIGKGRIKPFRSFVTPETTTQTGINKRMPKYFLNSNSTASSNVESNNDYKKKKKEQKSSRTDNSAISFLNRGKNLTAELFSNNKKSVATVSPRPIVSSGKNVNKRVLKGNGRPRRPGARFNKNNVARGKVMRRGKNTRRTTPFPIYTTATPNSEVIK